MIVRRHQLSEHFLHFDNLTHFGAMETENLTAYSDAFTACLGSSWSAVLSFDMACAAGIVFW